MPDRNFKKSFEKFLKIIENFAGFRLYAAVLLIIMFLTYDLQLNRMGFYYDDWEGIFLYKLNFSGWGIWSYFLSDRPFSALVHILFNPILGASSPGWHLLGLLLSWAAVLFFVKTILEIWPDQILAAGWMGFLLSLYPGITRLYVVRTSIPHYTSLLLFMVSLWLMVLSFKRERGRFLFLTVSLLLGGIQVLLVEYFSSLELIRIFLLVILSWQETRQIGPTLNRAFKFWLPYAGILVLFVAFKFVLLPAMQPAGVSPKHDLKEIRLFLTDPISTAINFSSEVLQDMVYAVFSVWNLAIVPQEIELRSRSYLFSWFLGALAGLMALVVMEAWVRKSAPKKSGNLPPLVLGLLAFFTIFLGGLPVWLIGRQAVGGLWSSRFLFGQALGVVPLVVMFILWLVSSERRWLQHVLLMILTISAVSYQFRVGNTYVKDWTYQRDFFWQLKWRIPALADGAFLVSPGSVTRLTVDYQTAYAVNILYSEPLGQNNMQHWWFNGTEELRSVKAGEANSERNVGRIFRSIHFTSSMAKAVPILSDLSRGCLLVADPIYQNAPLLSPAEKTMFLTSHPEMIKKDEVKPMPSDVFGKEPARTWCYYFEKADLERQYQEWDEVLKTWSQAKANKFEPGYGPEYLPFIEAFIQKGDWKQALELSERAKVQTSEMSGMLCSDWQKWINETQPSPGREETFQAARKAFSCETQ